MKKRMSCKFPLIFIFISFIAYQIFNSYIDKNDEDQLFPLINDKNKQHIGFITINSNSYFQRAQNYSQNYSLSPYISNQSESASDSAAHAFSQFLIDYGYQKNESIDCNNDSYYSKNMILRSIQGLFENKKYKHSLIFYSGHANEFGNLTIESKINPEETLSFKDVYNLWKYRKNKKQESTLLIIDASYAGLWIEEMNKNHIVDFSFNILTSCSNQPSYGGPQGGLFTANLLKALNFERQSDIDKFEENQSPQFHGLHFKIYENFKLPLFFISEVEMSDFKQKRVKKNTTLSDNGQYQGQRNKQGFIDGKGIQIWPEKHIYAGEWKNGSLNGKGSLQWSIGEKYEGDWNDNTKHGKGIYYFKDGRIYAGEWKNNNRHGKGRYSWKDGDVYMGDFKEGKRHGKGVYLWSNGDRYEGDYQADKQQGKGVYWHSDGRRYEGEFQADKKNGKGIYQWVSGDRYEGEWKLDKQHGKGIFYYMDGRVYDGEWKDGWRHGKGKQSWKSGDVYEGEYVQGYRNGKGTYIWNYGDKYEGEWKDDVKHGKGMYVYPNGYKYEGEWIDDQLEKITIQYNENGEVIDGKCKKKNNQILEDL